MFELGICVDLLDSSIPIRESLRSETEFDTNIDAPIRIHKYNLDNYLDSDYDDLDSEEVKHISNKIRTSVRYQSQILKFIFKIKGPRRFKSIPIEDLIDQDSISDSIQENKDDDSEENSSEEIGQPDISINKRPSMEYISKLDSDFENKFQNNLDENSDYEDGIEFNLFKKELFKVI